LSPADRRNIIEGLLDIQIFSTMSVLVKQRVVTNKEALDLNRVALKGAEDKKSYIERTLASLRQNSDDRLAEFQRQHDDLANQKKALLDKVKALADEKEALTLEIADLSDLRRSYEKHSRIIIQNESEADGYARDKVALNWGKECPTCKQEIEENFKKKRMKELDDVIGITLDRNKEVKPILDETLFLINDKEEKSKRIHAINSEIKSSKQTMMHFVSTMNDLEDSIDKITNADKLVQDSEKELEDSIEDIRVLETEKVELLEERKYVDTAMSLLKDGGIKTKIIKQYIPIINKQVNKYLAQMGFFVNFNIDENFNEVIKSRYRDEFSYSNFSEGEKTRIDLALLFTWRSIAKMKNSVNTNLLVLDEILDGSLDANGTDEFLKIIKSLTDGTNTFIISHKQDQLLDKFDRTYKFLKVKNFSQLVT
jgi:chromosome segregation ATPase